MGHVDKVTEQPMYVSENLQILHKVAMTNKKCS